MTNRFSFDGLLVHSSKDKASMRPVAERMRKDQLHVGLDNWEFRPGDRILTKIVGHNRGRDRHFMSIHGG